MGLVVLRTASGTAMRAIGCRRFLLVDMWSPVLLIALVRCVDFDVPLPSLFIEVPTTRVRGIVA